MAGRIRSIKPELREHAPFATLTDASARLFTMLYTIVDDEGRCPADAAFLAGAVFYGRPRAPNVVGRMVRELAKAGLIATYTAEGRQYLEIVDWHLKGSVVHQRIDKPQPGRYPAPKSTDSRNVPRTVHERSETDLRPPTSDPDQDLRPLAPARTHAIPPEPAPSTEPEPRTGKSAAPAERAVSPNVERIAATVWASVSAARVQIATELGIANVLPMPSSFGLPSEPRGCRDLRERVREEGGSAEAVCTRVAENLIAQAREEKSVDWLCEKAFTSGGWQTARNWLPGQQRRTRIGPRAIGSAKPRADHPEAEGPVDFGATP